MWDCDEEGTGMVTDFEPSRLLSQAADKQARGQRSAERLAAGAEDDHGTQRSNAGFTVGLEALLTERWRNPPSYPHSANQ